MDKKVEQSSLEIHKHDFHEITICLTGEYKTKINGKVIKLLPSQGIIINPNDTQENLFCHNERLIICISNSFLSDFKRMFNLKFEYLRQKFNFEIDANEVNENKVKVMLVEIILNNYIESEIKVEPWFMKAYKKTLLNIDQQLPFVEQFIVNTNLSQEYLMVYVKNKEGQSLSNFLNELRISDAKSKLKTTDEPVTKIAEGLGFKTAASFTTLFKKYENMTPKSYRIESQKGF